MAVGLIAWLGLGFVAGLAAQWVTREKPRDGCGGIIVAIVLGIAGAVIGGFIGQSLGWGKVDDFDLRSVLLAFVGAVLLLLVLRAIRKR